MYNVGNTPTDTYVQIHTKRVICYCVNTYDKRAREIERKPYIVSV